MAGGGGILTVVLEFIEKLYSLLNSFREQKTNDRKPPNAQEEGHDRKMKVLSGK